MFLFLPERDVVRVFEYLLAVAANMFGMRVHEVLCMSNHFHILLTDEHGRLPEFMNFFDSLLARSVNALRRTSGSVFEAEYGLVAEPDEDKIVAHAVYTLANPCTDHLVKRSRQWPGFSTLQMEYGQRVRIERPKVGLWKEEPEHRGAAGRGKPSRGKPSRLPEVVEFTLERPPVWMELSDAELRTEIRRRLDEREIELIEQRRRDGRDVLGRKGVLAQRWDGFPRTPEELFVTKPRVAGRLWLRIAALQQLRSFEEAYRRVRARFLEGERDVIWPVGTWLMRVRFGLPCEMAP